MGSSQIHQLTHSAAIIGSPSNAAIVQFTNNYESLVNFSISDGRDIGKIMPIPQKRSSKIKSWGSSNLLPNEIDEILCDNHITGEMMVTKRDIIGGNGISAYVESIVDGVRTRIPVDMPTKAAEWIEDTDFYDKYYTPAINNLVKLQNNFTEFMPSNNGKLIGSIMSRENKHSRIGEKDSNGDITSYHFCGDWSDQKKKVISLPPWNGKVRKSVFHNGDNFFNDGYYNIPTWLGSKEWIELANAIPRFHMANLSNGYTLRYHIEIPKDYFVNKNTLEKAGTDEKKIKACISAGEKAKQEFLDSLNAILAGINNAGRTITSTYEFDRLTKQHKGIKITAIEADLKDEALLKLFDKSNQATISGQGIHPTLANIESQGKLSSGSEMRNAFNFWVAVKTRTYRQHLLKPWQIVCKINGWNKKTDPISNKIIKYHIEDITLAKLDDDKSGTKEPLVKSEAA